MAGNHRSGPRPLPTALHVLRGTLRARHRKARALEPNPAPGRPAPSEDVQRDPEAMAEWERLATQLEATGVLTQAHGPGLSLLAQNLADLARVRTALHQMGYQPLVVDEIRDKQGHILRRKVKANPLLLLSQQLGQLCRTLLGEFGLTAATQTRVQVTRDVAKPTRTARYLA